MYSPMAKPTIFFFLLLLSLHSTNSQPTDFIKSECRTTRYPALCLRCLSSYSAAVQQSQRQLAHAAISVSLSRAESMASFISKLARMRGLRPAEYGAVKDCRANMADTVDQLSRSIRELGGMGRVQGQDFEWHVSNVQTWVSTALTNQNSCLDGFARAAMNGYVKVAVRKRMLDCAQVTSNALALVNRFAERHRDSGSTGLP